MPPSRKSAGRAVTPLRAPDVVPVRGLTLEPPAILPVAQSAELFLSPDDSGWSRQVQLEAPLLIDLPVRGLESVAAVRLEAQVAPGAPIAGLVLEREAELPEGGPPPLPRVARGGTRPVSELDPLRPQLQPAVLPGEGAGGDVLRLLRPYQLEAFQALIAQDVLLLADDAGLGKTIVACVAMMALFQRAQVKRALIVCPPGWQRHWARHLARWTPGMGVTVVRGERDERARHWTSAAQILLTDYFTAATDADRGAAAGPALAYDLIILDAPLAVRRIGIEPARALSAFSARRRWGLSGALPETPEDWLAVFRFLTPVLANVGAGGSAALDIRRRLSAHVLRRTRAELASQIPAGDVQEIWLDLEPAHLAAYREALAEERHRLTALGDELNFDQIAHSLETLQLAADFAPSGVESAKVRLLQTMAEDVIGGAGKLVIFSPYAQGTLHHLAGFFDRDAPLLFSPETSEEDRLLALRLFRQDPQRPLLLADVQARTDGRPLTDASLLVHFDHDWNPVARRRAEARLRLNQPGAAPPLVCELWVAGTIDETLHRAFARRGLLDPDTLRTLQTHEVAQGLTEDEWLREVFETERGVSIRREEPPARPTGTTGVLPGTDLLRSEISDMTPQELLAGVLAWIGALGFPEAEILEEASERGGEILAARTLVSGKEQVIVRLLRTDKNVGVSEAKSMLRELNRREDLLGGYLVVTADFTPACKKLAEESQGKLELVSGAELARHLHILGKMG
jgi:hypothetical protein